jgi:hypothetical protein
MSASTDLPALSMRALPTEGVSLNYSTISSVLTLLGWRNPHPTIAQAEEAERALAERLKTAYTQYSAFPDEEIMAVIY